MSTTAGNRSNAQWLDELRSERAEHRDRALADLRDYLRRTLAGVLKGRTGIHETDLEDFTQDALLKVLDGLERFRGDSRFTTWATAVGIRVALGNLRLRRYRERPLEDADQAEAVGARVSAEPDPGGAFQRRALVEALHEAITERLTERQRKAVLAELSGVPSSVLAQQLGTNPNALYKLHHDARKKLKAALNDAGYSDEDVRRELVSASEQ